MRAGEVVVVVLHEFGEGAEGEKPFGGGERFVEVVDEWE